MSKRKKIAALSKQLSDMRHKLDKLSKKHDAIAQSIAGLMPDKTSPPKPAKKKKTKPAAKAAVTKTPGVKRAKKPMKPTLVKSDTVQADKAAS